MPRKIDDAVQLLDEAIAAVARQLVEDMQEQARLNALQQSEAYRRGRAAYFAAVGGTDDSPAN